MLAAPDVSSLSSSRQLKRLIRSQPDLLCSDDAGMPESVLWRAYCELKRRGEEDPSAHFLRSMKTLHRRRSIGTADLSVSDVHPDEHKLVDDPLLGELWKAYKRCICNQRPGPASQLLREIANQIE